MTCGINVESVLTENGLGFAQNSFKSTLLSAKIPIIFKALFEFDV